MKVVDGKLVADSESEPHTDEHLSKTIPATDKPAPTAFAVVPDTENRVRPTSVVPVSHDSDSALNPLERATLAKSNEELAKAHEIPAWPPAEIPQRPEVSKTVAEDVKGRFLREETTEKIELRNRITAILADYGGMESNIPYTHEYWDLLNRFRATK